MKKKRKTRLYDGVEDDKNTIHDSRHFDVEVDDEGNVIAVWFRCLRIPFRVFNRNWVEGGYLNTVIPGDAKEIISVEIPDERFNG